MGVNLEGAYRGDEWGAVILAQWEIIKGGTVTRLLVPPAAIQAIRAPKTFAKIEITAAYRLKGHARRLYAALADKKHMGQSYWEYPLGELQRLFHLEGKYPKWYDFSRYVLTPALEEINDFGTVTVKATPKKLAALSALSVSTGTGKTRMTQQKPPSRTNATAMPAGRRRRRQTPRP